MSSQKKSYSMMDGNSAVAYVAHATNEVIAIYPITPSTGMSEIADEKSARKEKNIWGTVPIVVEMQSEGGVAGAVHGSLTTGALTTTFTASQGLLLMIPNMYKIAGELTATVFHVAARSLACQALSIFGDHSDVMAARATGFGLLASGSPQEAMDMALISQRIALESRIPFVHFFDGFRTSHEINRVEEISFDAMRAYLPDHLIQAHRKRGLTPDRPTMRGTSQNPDVYFQGRETVNPFYIRTPGIVENVMREFAGLTGRSYRLFDYVGAKDAENVVIMMGSGAETMHEVVDFLVAKGEKVGLIKVRLYRPFSLEHLVKVLPATTKSVVVLDRTKEPGAPGEPLYIDVRNSIGEALECKIAPFSVWPKIIGGRYGLGSKDFDPTMCKAVIDNLKAAQPKNHFTVGIIDDVTQTNLPLGGSFDPTGDGTIAGMFYGLGSDGTVGANKDSIKIIGEYTDNFAQGYFVYDSKKSGSMTVSHLRFGKKQMRSSCLVTHADFVACHNFSFIEKYDMLTNLKRGGTFLLASALSPEETWNRLPIETQQHLIKKKAKFYTLDAFKHAKAIGLKNRINTLMQTAFFEISKVLPRTEYVPFLKKAIAKTYSRKGDEIVKMNCQAIDVALANIVEVKIPEKVTATWRLKPPGAADSSEFAKSTLGPMMVGKGDSVPVSKMPSDGTFPTATTRFEKRNIALEIPVWDPSTCIQCGMCSLVCPHAAIRTKIYDPELLSNAPKTFKHCEAKGYKDKKLAFTVQVAPEDCTGCRTCTYNCPAFQKDANGQKLTTKAINMAPQQPLRAAERENFTFFLGLPNPDPALFDVTTIKGSQLVQPLFEFSGACSGCGETAYIKLLTQLYGDRLLIANATGCSSIYGGNLPSTPYCQRADGRGPAWSNSLFEDNAEFGFGMQLAIDKMAEEARELLQKLINCGCEPCKKALPIMQETLTCDQRTTAGVETQRKHVAALKAALSECPEPGAARFLTLADFLVRRSVWIVGGDGWAYDIGYGGLDHVLASGRNVKVLVLDTEVYSNTGGQMSKATPLGAVVKFAAGGKPLPKKDLGMIAMSYGTIYVAKVALGANQAQTLKAFVEAENYDGPAIVLAYSHCISHGIDMSCGLGEHKKAVASGHWPLYRFNPELLAQGKNPLQLDSKDPTLSIEEYMMGENRFRSLMTQNKEAAQAFIARAQKDVKLRWNLYKSLAEAKFDSASTPSGGA